jgi:hypothetical protein
MDNAVPEFEKGVGELERLSGWEPGGLVADEVDLSIREARDEPEILSEGDKFYTIDT